MESFICFLLYFDSAWLFSTMRGNICLNIYSWNVWVLDWLSSQFLISDKKAKTQMKYIFAIEYFSSLVEIHYVSRLGLRWKVKFLILGERWTPLIKKLNMLQNLKAFSSNIEKVQKDPKKPNCAVEKLLLTPNKMISPCEKLI